MIKLIKRVFQYLKYSLALKLLKMKNGEAPKILKVPDERLKQICEEIDLVTIDKKWIRETFKQMYSALQAQSHGDKLGLAAPQIGVLKRMIIVKGVPMINPTWKPTNAPKERSIEGCYSQNEGDLFQVWRDKYGWATWYDLNGELQNYKIKGIHAIVFQHELDHLDGKCLDTTGKLITKSE